MEEKLILPAKPGLESGSVKQYTLSKGRKVTQITTFCPDFIGPGPTNLYVIEDKALTLVDTGLPTHLAKKIFYYWRNQKIPSDIKELPDNLSEMELISGLDAAGYSLKDIERLIITHGHLDHFLMGGAIVKKSNAKVLAHIMDTDRISNPWGLARMVFEGRPKYSAMGMPMPVYATPEYTACIKKESDDLFLKVDYPLFDEGPLCIDGIISDFITVKHTPGHSPGSISLIVGSDEDEKRLLISGDVILYPITPHPNDLVEYLRTLDKLSKVKNISMALPAHGMNIMEVNARIEFLIKHHHSRLKFAFDACKEPKTVWNVATKPGCFDVFVDPEKFNPLAGNEAYIHMELLEKGGGIQRLNNHESIHYFQNSGEEFEDVYKRIMGIVDYKISTVFN